MMMTTANVNPARLTMMMTTTATTTTTTTTRNDGDDDVKVTREMCAVFCTSNCK
jgi:hypothetical protein